jgi:hypothetical protein
MNRVLLVIACALAGCAALECDTDWYETGRRDGRIGASEQADYYVARCGGKVDRKRYAEGWEVGRELRPHGPAL